MVAGGGGVMADKGLYRCVRASGEENAPHYLPDEDCFNTHEPIGKPPSYLRDPRVVKLAEWATKAGQLIESLRKQYRRGDPEFWVESELRTAIANLKSTGEKSK